LVVDAEKVLSLEEFTFDSAPLTVQLARGLKQIQLPPAQVGFSEPQVANGNILVVIHSR